MKDASIVHDRIREARELRDWTQEELGLYCGLSAMAVCHFERGRRKPCAANLVRLARALMVSSDYLLGLKDTP